MKAAIFHTSSATLGLFQSLAAKTMPDVEVMHIVEDSMIREVMKSGGPTPSINARIAGYVQAAERAGCSVFMTACSSIGASVEHCQDLTSMPVTRVDEAMVEEAIQKGPRVAVLATVETTLKPTLEYIERKAKQSGKEIVIQAKLMSEAFKALLDGDNKTHDAIVSAGLKEAMASADVVVLAQASMARVMVGMDAPTVPVLTSPERGVTRLKERLDALV
ncbi:aspartate/glutamate racemase family protein [Propionivibrio soli]|uniref:aspartate/glutamate racemase family protein n=1 Tax=Propionivibrio soli TaxID=2976531 RepID=UPI0021E7A224